MGISRCWHLTSLILVAAFPIPSRANEPIVSYPQIVRISYVQGDVRISRDDESKGATWETAEANVPVESGFNLVTGATGRAEIEFEDTSTVYLAENSVLTFNNLETDGNVPYTDLALLSGTATLHIHLGDAGELLILRTPTNAITLRYPNDSYLRVESYLDGMRVTPQQNMTIGNPDGLPPVNLIKGTTTSFGEGGQIPRSAAELAALAAWDDWVANRVEMREAAMSSMMRDLGLTSPIPGLADLYGQGNFFACEPYGTCWQPKDAPEQPEVGELHHARLVFVSMPLQLGQNGTAASPWPNRRPHPYDGFPCLPPRIRPAGYQWQPYDWALCHAGTWIYRRHRYTWVAGNKRHHLCPVHWIKSGRTLAYVPIHPRDVPGKLPINRVNGVFAVDGKKDATISEISLRSDDRVKVLKSPPTEFRGVYLPSLARAQAPLAEIRRIGESPGVKSEPLKLAFNTKSQSFLLAKGSISGSRNIGGLRTFNDHIGSIQAGRTSSFGGVWSHGGSFHSAGSSGGGGVHGAGSSGGGFHGASGGGGASGGAHGGGGGPR